MRLAAPKRRGRPPGVAGPMTRADLARVRMGLERIRLDEARARSDAMAIARISAEIARLEAEVERETAAALFEEERARVLAGLSRT